jgi:broad specificity phosphatase PhoE
MHNVISSLEESLKSELMSLGIVLDIATGHLFYDTNFIPLKLNYELLFVRHGETYGNCGQSSSKGHIDANLVKLNIKNQNSRIFQGCVNEDINQLTSTGIRQAQEAAKQIENQFLKNGWKPDIIYHSPLSRARNTALPFIEQNNLWHFFQLHDGIREMSFGSWDNRRICDFSIDDKCHQFYRNQNALIKNSGINGNGVYQKAESFCEVILRARRVLLDLEKTYFSKKIMFFSHSMFGAACCILLGKGQKVEGDNYLAFDGKRQDGSSYVLQHCKPIILT